MISGQRWVCSCHGPKEHGPKDDLKIKKIEIEVGWVWVGGEAVGGVQGRQVWGFVWDLVFFCFLSRVFLLQMSFPGCVATASQHETQRRAAVTSSPPSWTRASQTTPSSRRN